LKSKKSPSRIRRFRKTADVSKGFARHVRRMLGI
jgi:ribosomal protein L35